MLPTQDIYFKDTNSKKPVIYQKQHKIINIHSLFLQYAEVEYRY